MNGLFGLIAKKRINVLFQAMELIHTFGKHTVQPTRLDRQNSEKHSSHLTPPHKAKMKKQSH